MHLRPGGFYTNFYGSIEMIKNGGFMGNNFDESVKMILTHPQDIADAAFEALDTLSFKGTHIRYIVSDIKSGSELTRILGDAIGKEDLKWMHFSDQQLLEGLVRNGFSKDAAQHYIVDMGVAIREGILDKHYEENRHEVFGRISFSEFAKEFAFVYGKTQEMAY
jgi:nucleoside-diphosphate-sugar epimerase